MTRADELRALAARVEAAQGADAELDAAIWIASGEAAHAWDFTKAEHDRSLGFYDFAAENAPAFTASLDAAASLVPAGWGYELRRGHSGARKALCRMWNGRGIWNGGTVAATPALALTAACLRALAEEEEGE